MDDIKGHGRRFGGLAMHLLRRFIAHHCLTSAGSLSFTSLLAIVPLAAISFALLAAFPVFGDMGGTITSFILKNFSPDAGNAIQEVFATFVRNATGLSGAGVLFLIFTSALLLYEIELTFNEIWQAPERRTLLSRLMIFWTVVTLGPILLGLVLSLSAPIFASAMQNGAAVESISLLTYFLPLALEITGFSLLYIALPNCPVQVRHAITGGVIAGLLFEALKLGFGVYIRNFAAYDAIYGALSALPVFLIWTYLSWAVILFGGVVTAGLPEIRDQKAGN